MLQVVQKNLAAMPNVTVWNMYSYYMKQPARNKETELNGDYIQTCSSQEISNIVNCWHILYGTVDLFTNWHYHLRPILWTVSSAQKPVWTYTTNMLQMKSQKTDKNITCIFHVKHGNDVYLWHYNKAVSTNFAQCNNCQSNLYIRFISYDWGHHIQ